MVGSFGKSVAGVSPTVRPLTLMLLTIGPPGGSPCGGDLLGIPVKVHFSQVFFVAHPVAETNNTMPVKESTRLIPTSPEV